MSKLINKQFKLAARPVGLAKRSDWTYEEVPAAEPKDGELLIKVQYISLDPAMRGWMNAGRSYIRPVEIGEVMRAGTIGEVVASRHPQFKEGDIISGTQGVQSYAISDGKGLFKLDPEAGAPCPSTSNVLEHCPASDRLFRSAGGRRAQSRARPWWFRPPSARSGQVVEQIAKIKGCRAVGIAGGADKCALAVKEFGYDACIDYKAGPLQPGLGQHCPEGVDVYFDNVGGDILDAVLTRIRMKARIAICGAISQYNATEVKGPKNYMSLLVNRARMEGMVVFDWQARYGEAMKEMGRWMARKASSSRARTSSRASRPSPRPCSSCSTARTWAN